MSCWSPPGGDELQAGSVNWLSEQEHYGENIGDTETHGIFFELKASATAAAEAGIIGPGLRVGRPRRFQMLVGRADRQPLAAIV
jgi:hypothetical protein